MHLTDTDDVVFCRNYNIFVVNSGQGFCNIRIFEGVAFLLIDLLIFLIKYRSIGHVITVDLNICSCHSSQFKYRPIGHVITVDLNNCSCHSSQF
jgi:hypothetical protein